MTENTEAPGPVENPRARTLAALVPQFQQLEADREFKAQQLNPRIVQSLIAGAVLALVLLLVLGWSYRGLAFLGILGGLGLAVYLTFRAQKDWSDQVTEALMPALCAAWGEVSYARSVPRSNFVEPFLILNTVGAHNSSTLEHYFSGRTAGRRFEMVHADLKQASRRRRSSSGSSSIPVFYGLLIRVELVKRAPLPILILPASTLTNRVRDMTPVDLEAEDFEASFRVHVPGDRPDGPGLAGAFVDETWQQALLAINRNEGRPGEGFAALSVGLIDDSCYIALTRWAEAGQVGKIRFERPRPFLEVPWLLRRSASLESAVGSMLDDIGVAFRIIDRLPAG